MLAAWIVVLAALAFPVQAIRGVPADEELTNFRLSPSFNRWLVGPIFHLASAEEVESYLALPEDAAAAAFVEAFWRRRGPPGQSLGASPRQLFERRRDEADTLFSRPPAAGHQTDPGVVYVLFGPPDRKSRPRSSNVDEPVREVWHYDERPRRLDGRRGRSRYIFTVESDGSLDLQHALD